MIDQVTIVSSQPKCQKRGRQIVVEEVFPDPADSDFTSLEAAIEASLPFLTKLIDPHDHHESQEAD